MKIYQKGGTMGMVLEIGGHIDKNLIRRYSTPLKWSSENADIQPIGSCLYKLR